MGYFGNGFRPLQWLNRSGAPMTVGLVSLLAVQTLCAPMVAVADTIHLYNGKIIKDCDIKKIVGDLIHYKYKNGRLGKINRMEINGSEDVVRIFNMFKPVYIRGRLVYMDPYYLEVDSNEGNMKVSKWRIRDIIVGRPKVASQAQRIILSGKDGGAVDEEEMMEPIPATERNPRFAPLDSQPVELYDPQAMHQAQPQTYGQAQTNGAGTVDIMMDPNTRPSTGVSQSSEYYETYRSPVETSHASVDARPNQQIRVSEPPSTMHNGYDSTPRLDPTTGEVEGEANVSASKRFDDEVTPTQPPWYDPLHPVRNRLPGEGF